MEVTNKMTLTTTLYRRNPKDIMLLVATTNTIPRQTIWYRHGVQVMILVWK
jgi:hypothetical protein